MTRKEASSPTPLLDWKGVLGAGLAGAVAMALLELALGAAAGEPVWAQLRMVAGIILGADVVTPPWTFEPLPAAAAVAVHVGLSLLYATIGALAFHRLALVPSLLLGAMLGFLLYIINFYGFVAWFEWFSGARNLLTVVAHLAFGIVVAGTYHGIRRWDARCGRQPAVPTLHSRASQTHRTLGPFRVDINWNAAVFAALISGAAFVVLDVLLTWLVADQSPWRSMYHIAGIALGPEAVPERDEPAGFSWRILVAAILVHFTLSLIYSTVGGILLSPLARRSAVLAGAACGLALYVINFYGFAQVFYWFREARGWVPIVVHLTYGLIAAWGHRAWRERLEG